MVAIQPAAKPSAVSDKKSAPISEAPILTAATFESKPAGSKKREDSNRVNVNVEMNLENMFSQVDPAVQTESSALVQPQQQVKPVQQAPARRGRHATDSLLSLL